MAKNLIPKIAELLGLELGEKFKIKGDVGTYEFGLEGLWGDYGTDAEALEAILCGSAEIAKLPWKPKKGDAYFTFVLMGDKWGVGSLHWGGFPNEYGLLEKGWVYRTCAEAQSALPAVAKEIGAEYELPTSYTETVEQWEPKVGETYYSFCRFLGEWCAWQQQWSNHPFDLALLAKGWVYRTQEEAEAALPKVAAELGVEYKL